MTIAVLLLPRSGRAHTPGLTVADFDVQTDGRVEARMAFARAEPLAGVALDRDGDGIVTDDDVAGALDDLRAFVLGGVGIDADGSTCAPAFRDALLTEADGLVLRATYACPADAANIEVILYFLSAPPVVRTGTLRGIARIQAGNATTEGLLTGEHRAIALHLPGRDHVPAHDKARIVGLAAAATALGLLAYGWKRWRAALAA